ncbi:MAG: DEAD/DEAH box helicase [Pedosphaera sp.]|nr:DEAD/DEAH box helicase [Pedosphaera sp.]
MAKPRRKNAKSPRPSNGASKYDAHHTALTDAYGEWADLRRALSDTKGAASEREDLLRMFSTCSDSQRAWLLLEDYLGKLKLTRRDFPGEEWWPLMVKARETARLEQLAVLFLRSKRTLPNELSAHVNLDRFAEIEALAEESDLLQRLERWMFPPEPQHLDQPCAQLRAVCTPIADDGAAIHWLSVEFHITRPRKGERKKPLADIIELTTRATHEQELFSPHDWEFISWLADRYSGEKQTEVLRLGGQDLLEWLVQWGDQGRIVSADGLRLEYHGQVAELMPDIKNGTQELSFTHTLHLPGEPGRPLEDAQFFAGSPTLLLIDRQFYFLRQAPPSALLVRWLQKPFVPITKLSHRFITKLRRTHRQSEVDWDQLCVAHPARPQFLLELAGDAVQIRLQAKSERDESMWEWTGHEWNRLSSNPPKPGGKPEILDDPRLEPAKQWLLKLDCFTPEPGCWVGDAGENFLNLLATMWEQRPKEVLYLGNQAFQRLFLSPRRLKPNLIVRGSGIDWLSVSAEWENEGFQLSKADLARLATATSRFVKLPDSGWIELDVNATQSAHETLAEMGLSDLSTAEQRVAIEQAAHLDEATLALFGNTPQARKLRERIANFEGITSVDLPDSIEAELRPYQKEGFNFLCHLNRLGLGGVLADDMGLGKTLQTLTWLKWLKERNTKNPKPSLVICPASVLHNWRREAEKFIPGTRVLVLESGAARHNLRNQIPQHDLIVTNYALLRRDLEELQKFSFRAVILDEAQFIKNPSAQVTQSVKQIKSECRLALTGTPIENRLMDLWSIIDFVEPSYLGSSQHFHEVYEPQGDSEESIAARKISRRRLSSRLRPILLRRIKQQVAKDLPDRIDQRQDCPLTEDQRKLYLAELRRSRDQVMQTIEQQGLAKSKMQVLAALTRLRQICCHPILVGNDSASGKTEALFDLLEPLIERGEKVLVFSQFVRMLNVLETECKTRQISTHMLTGETKNRQEVVNAFQADTSAAVFLLSLRAAGTGLNLTAASYVVLYDPWWNPAVEAQAIDRTHRIGQTKTVNAYRLIAPGTVEEKIWSLQQSKSQTIADVLGEEGFAKSLTQTDLEFLFAED